jgi:hypothetical protein
LKSGRDLKLAEVIYHYNFFKLYNHYSQTFYLYTMRRNILCICIASLLLITSCKKPLTREALYGRWNYIKVENPNSHPPDSVKHADLVAASPYVIFTKDSLLIWWGGQELSHGTFSVAGDSIRMNEILPGNTTRKFAFYVTGLTGKQIIFSTRGVDGAQVTAVRAH